MKFKKKKELNIGIIIFGIIFIYLIATIVMYVTAPHVSVYEVRQGSILKDNAYTGLAIREETVVYAEASGYINYFVTEGSKVKVGSDIYTISNNALKFEETAATEDNSTLATENQYSILLQIQDFNQNFQESNFSNCYNLKNNLENTLSSNSSQNKLNQLYSMISQSSGISVFDTLDDGVVVYAVDGMEGTTVENATLSLLDQTNYKKTAFANNTQVQSGNPVYKLITSDNWSVIIELSEETAKLLQEKKSVKVNFTSDDQSMRASFELKQEENRYYALLHFQDSMVRYANERYLNIELILEDETGLKIPKSAETTKDFYIIPKSYVTQGGNSSSNGILKKSKDADGNDITVFTTVDIYYEDEEVVYLDPNKFNEGTVIVEPETNNTYELKETRSLKGVYCINKGYAVFKQINILCESDDYYIVEEGNSYGLSNYDHIALDSSNIKENDVVF